MLLITIHKLGRENMKKILCILLSMASLDSFVFGMDQHALSYKTALVVAQNRKSVFVGIQQCDLKRFNAGWSCYRTHLRSQFNAPVETQPGRTAVSTNSGAGVSSSRALSSTVHSQYNIERTQAVQRVLQEKTPHEIAHAELSDLVTLVESKTTQAPQYTAGCYKFRQSLKGVANGLVTMLGFWTVFQGIGNLYTSSNSFEKLVGTGLFAAGTSLTGLFGWRTFKNAANVYYADRIVNRRKADIKQIQQAVTSFSNEITDLSRHDGRGE
jgi:hypothetical protein